MSNGETQSNETQHNHTNSADELSPLQLNVLDRLIAGERKTAAAAAEGCNVWTIHNWLKNDYAFQAEYNRRRRELCDASANRGLALLHAAWDTIEADIEGGSVPSSIVLLKALGFLSGERPSIGSTDPEQLERNDAPPIHDPFDLQSLLSGLR